MTSVPLHPNRKPGPLLHALPAPPARRRFALPGVLLGVAGLAVSALAVLPTPVAASDVLVVEAAAAAAPQLAVPPLEERLPPQPWLCRTTGTGCSAVAEAGRCSE